MFTVYAIKSEFRNYIYVGFTSDIQVRIQAHNRGYNKTTKPYAPFVLIYSEKCQSRSQARLREKYLKSGSGKKFLKSLL